SPDPVYRLAVQTPWYRTQPGTAKGRGYADGRVDTVSVSRHPLLSEGALRHETSKPVYRTPRRPARSPCPPGTAGRRGCAQGALPAHSGCTRKGSLAV